MGPVRSNATLAEAVRVALRSLQGNKMRSFLTLLGVIVATATLIGVIAVIEGMDQYIASTVLSEMGSNVFVIERFPIIGDMNPKKFLEMRRRNPPLREEEYQFLKEHLTLARDVGLETGRGLDARVADRTITDVHVRGMTPNMINIQPLRVAQGRYIAEPDNDKHVPVVLIGHDLKEKFFPSVDPVGKTVDLQGRPFQVIGVAESQGSIFGQSRDNFAVIPVETFFKMYGRRGGLSYNVAATGPETIEQTMDQARMLMRAYRHLKPNQEDNFGLFAADSFLDLWDRMTRALAATMVGVVSVFMVVGGVVIMNIMLAAVTERTHEIGVRKSVGARRSDILLQFLVEAAVLAGCGGLLGTLCAWLVAIVVRAVTPVPMAVPPYAVLLAVGVSATVGLFFGIYPAHRASRLDPIVALRSET